MNKPKQDQPFDPNTFNKQIEIDNLMRATMIGLAVLAGLAAVLMPSVSLLSGLVAPCVIIGLWLWWSTSTAKAGKTLSEVGGLMASDPEQASQLISQALAQRPVMRWARLLTYHRLAGLRHVQRRFNESAAICLCLLAQPLRGPAATIRPHLLLMLAEAELERDNLPGAYHALAHLQQTRLSLIEALQRLTLQTRYELAAHAYDAALHRSRAKVELAELMPAPHCAAMHAMLATAAQRRGNTRLADWLWERTRLLAPDALRDQLERGHFGVEVVDHDLPGNTPSTP